MRNKVVGWLSTGSIVKMELIMLEQTYLTQFHGYIFSSSFFFWFVFVFLVYSFIAFNVRIYSELGHVTDEDNRDLYCN